MSFGEVAALSAAALLEELGEPAAFTPAGGSPRDTNIVLNETAHDVGLPLPGQGMSEPQLTAELLRADVGVPKRGDAFYFTDAAAPGYAGRRFKVDAVIEVDPFIVKVAAQELSA
ncbi:MAG TPA: hypothetical protein VHE37_08940 [Nevskiaceae bacterium]|nr:hypothetical protein [Nevskiaceae bacterium]